MVLVLSASITSVSLSTKWTNTTICTLRELRILRTGTHMHRGRGHGAWDFSPCSCSPLTLSPLFSQITGYSGNRVENDGGSYGSYGFLKQHFQSQKGPLKESISSKAFIDHCFAPGTLLCRSHK